MSTIEEKRARAQRMGIPMPVTQMNEGGVASVPVTASNQDKYARLAALKSGANRQKVQNLVKSSSVQGQQGFQGLPEPVMKKNPNHPGNQLSDPSKAVPVQQNFGGVAPVSSEFSAIEAMYGGGNDTAAYSQQPVLAPQNNANMQTSQPELSIPTQAAGPVFDPVAMLQQKRMQEQHVPQQQSSEYLQYAVNPQAAQTPQQGQFDFNNMQKMMQEIAKQTISEVLSEFTEKSKKNLTYENVKTKNGVKVIKTQDGKYYKLTPVTLTKG
jgi:hypothetical protein